MAVVWMRARAELRQRWRSWLALTLLVGIVGGVGIAAAAGARRTSTAFDRLLIVSKAHDVEIQPVEEVPEGTLDRIAALPQVSADGKVALFPAGAQARGGDPEPFSWNVTAAAALGDGLARRLDIPRVTRGREMRFDDPLEAMVSEAFVRQRGVGVGDDFTIQLATWPELFEFFGGRSVIPTAPEVTLRIVGIWKLPHDVSIAAVDAGLLYLSPAFAQSYAPKAAALEGLMVRLRNGEADVPAFMAAARALVEDPNALSFTTQEEINADVARAVDVMAAGLWVMAGVLGAVVLLVIGQSLSRAMTVSGDDLPILRALALGSGQRMIVLLAPMVFTAIAGAALAVLTAFLLSPATPLGFAREIEPAPGFRFDAMVVGIGAAALVVGMIARALPSAIVLVRRTSQHPSIAAIGPSPIATGAVRAGLSPAIVAGIRFALEPGRGPSAVPVRSVLGGVVASMVAVIAVFSFGPSLDKLLSEPPAYGWTWDVTVFGGEDTEVVTEQIAGLRDHPDVADLAVMAIRTATVGDEGLQLIGVRHERGLIDPTVLEGRAPRAHDEIALGAEALERHGLAIGDVLEVPARECDDVPGCSLRMSVVGKVVPPALDGADLGAAGMVTLEALDRLSTTGGFIDYLVRLRPGVEVDAARADFERLFGDAATATPPVELLNLDRVRALPDVLAALLVLVVLAVMAHALVTAVRRRNRDLAILKTLGFRRAQTRATVAWQATTTIVVALVIGIPAGLVAGRWLWRIIAGRLGVSAEPVTSALPLVIGALGLVLAANIVGAWPARRAARTQPAIVLRSE